MVLAERFDGALNHCRKIATETVGHGGRAGTVAVVESAACGCESGQHVVFATGAAGQCYSLPPPALRECCYRRGVHARPSLHVYESCHQRATGPVPSFGFSPPYVTNLQVVATIVTQGK